MATVLKIGPADQGRQMSLEEFQSGDFDEGYKYELIHGRLYVSPEANLPEDWMAQRLLDEIKDYIRDHPDVINFATNKARVFVSKRAGVTCPEPDLAAYHNFPRPKDLRQLRELRWQDVSPILVAEILGEGDPTKDLERNVKLYLQVPSIKEYWLIDMRDEADSPRLRVHRRHGKKWRIFDVSPGDTYPTKLLPGFQLVLEP